MNGYRNDKKLSDINRRGVGWHSAGYGIGMLAVALFVAITSGSAIFSGILAIVGIPLLAYGLRNP
jgi:hypothetical protein